MILISYSVIVNTPHILWRGQLVVELRMAELVPIDGYNCTKTAISQERLKRKNYLQIPTPPIINTLATRSCPKLSMPSIYILPEPISLGIDRRHHNEDI